MCGAQVVVHRLDTANIPYLALDFRRQIPEDLAISCELLQEHRRYL